MPCHTRILDDGSVVVGAQGNHSVDCIRGYRLLRLARSARPAAANQVRQVFADSSVPWLSPDPAIAVADMTPEQLHSPKWRCRQA